MEKTREAGALGRGSGVFSKRLIFAPWLLVCSHALQNCVSGLGLVATARFHLHALCNQSPRQQQQQQQHPTNNNRIAPGWGLSRFSGGREGGWRRGDGTGLWSRENAGRTLLPETRRMPSPGCSASKTIEGRHQREFVTDGCAM